MIVVIPALDIKPAATLFWTAAIANTVPSSRLFQCVRSAILLAVFLPGIWTRRRTLSIKQRCVETGTRLGNAAMVARANSLMAKRNSAPCPAMGSGRPRPAWPGCMVVALMAVAAAMRVSFPGCLLCAFEGISTDFRLLQTNSSTNAATRRAHLLLSPVLVRISVILGNQSSANFSLAAGSFTLSFKCVN